MKYESTLRMKYELTLHMKYESIMPRHKVK